MENKKINLISLINELNNEIWNNKNENFKLKKSCEDTSEDFKISELFMHKILFFTYGSFYKNFKRELFKGNFEAWKYGPVEIDYRNEILKKNFSFDKFNIYLVYEDEKIYLNKVITYLLKCSVWMLVEISHDTSAWRNNYDPTKNNCKISKEDIIKSFESIDI